MYFTVVKTCCHDDNNLKNVVLLLVWHFHWVLIFICLVIMHRKIKDKQCYKIFNQQPIWAEVPLILSWLFQEDQKNLCSQGKIIVWYLKAPFKVVRDLELILLTNNLELLEYVYYKKNSLNKRQTLQNITMVSLLFHNVYLSFFSALNLLFHPKLYNQYLIQNLHFSFQFYQCNLGPPLQGMTTAPFIFYHNEKKTKFYSRPSLKGIP